MARDAHAVAARAAASLVVAVALLGCAPLTTSQVRAVHDYAEATQGYSTLPGDVVRSYAAIHEDAAVFSRAAAPSPPDAGAVVFDRFLRTARLRAKLDGDAQDLDQTLGILDEYASLLGTLSSDDFTESLAKSAADLSEATDAAIETYDKERGARLPTFGSELAEGVRAAGGYFLRRQQAHWLKTYVDDAAPMVETLSARVESLLDDYAPQDPKAPNLLDGEIDDLRATVTLLVASRSDVDLARAQELQSLLDRILATRRLAQAARQSAVALREAHRALHAAVQTRHGLSGRIEPVKALAAEVKAGAALKKSLDAEAK